MRKQTAWIVAGVIATCAAGCQSWRNKTAGERMVMAAERQPEAPAVDPASLTPAPPPSTVAVVAPPSMTTSIVPPRVAAPTTTGPVVAPLYVAADADEATRLRNWPLSMNEYASGNFIAGPTYRIQVPPPRSNGAVDVHTQDLFQTAMTIPQMFATPVWAIFQPPLTPVEYHGEVYPPSYTVDDPFPYYENEYIPGMVQMKRTK